MGSDAPRAARPVRAAPLQDAARLLEEEALALLTRLDRVRPFALHETMVPAAAVSVTAQRAIERYLMRGRRALRREVRRYVAWLRGPGRRAPASAAHARFAVLRLQFNVVLANFDLFAIVMTQRSEHETGVWLSGLDIVASDALALPGVALPAPPVVCYLDRGLGAAIRRAKTRLPGGGENPVAIVRLPRERMIGSGVASSLVHEVGHQAAVLLDLVAPLRERLDAAERAAPPADRRAWGCWARWISEIVADLWSVSRVGITATLGLVGVVSLPRPFVIRGASSDPHPIPWIRVRLSCALGDALYPDPQWRRLSALWAAFYPPDDMPRDAREELSRLERTMPALVRLLLAHRPARLGGRSLGEALASPDRGAERLRAHLAAWRPSLARLRAAPPTLAFAVIGQARADGRMSAAEESQLLGGLLTYWALRGAVDPALAATARPATPAAGRAPGTPSPRPPTSPGRIVQGAA